MEEFKAILDAISTTGFPIAVTVYLLWERNSTMQRFTSAINELTSTTKLLSEYVKGGINND